MDRMLSFEGTWSKNTMSFQTLSNPLEGIREFNFIHFYNFLVNTDVSILVFITAAIILCA